MNPNKQSLAPVNPPGTKRRVFVIEDHPLMRRSIVEAILREPDLTVCGQAEDVPEVLVVVSAQPDVVLTDIQLQFSSGLDLIKSLQARLPDLPVVATTMFDLRRAERLARTAGAAGFVSKQDGPDQMIAAIREALTKRGEHDAGA